MAGSEEPEEVHPEPAQKANALLGEAVLLRAQGKRKEGLAKCQEALKLLPENAEAFEILGDLYAETGLPEAAIEAYKRVLELDPARLMAETKIARAALQKQRIEQQRQLAQDLLEGRLPRGQTRSPATAGLLSLLLPGLGQAYNHHWLKAAALLCIYVFLFLGAVATALRTLTAQQPSAGPGLDLFTVAGAFFVSPAIWWTLLLILLYLYSVGDAALAATRSAAEETGMV